MDRDSGPYDQNEITPGDGTAMTDVRVHAQRDDVPVGNRARLASRLFRLSTLLVLMVGGLVLALLPMPWLVFAPSPPRPVEAMVSIEGAPRELSGHLLASSAGYRRATPALALWALIDPTRDVKPRPDPDHHRATTSRDHSIQESVMVAATVALRLAGREASVMSDGLEVLAVAAEDPVADVLQPGDLLLEANGDPLVVPSDLRVLADAPSLHDTVKILRLRNGSRQLVDVPINTSDTRRRIEVTTAAVRPVLALPAGATIAAKDVDGNGGSAGLMLALAVYDRFANEPIIGNRSVSGTGTVDLEGGVSVIEGLRQKVIAAEEAGVSLFFVPAPQFEEAVSSTRGAMQIVPVSTVNEAIVVLRGL